MKFRRHVAGFAAASAASQMSRADSRSFVVVLSPLIRGLGVFGDALAHLLDGGAIYSFGILLQVCIQVFENVLPLLKFDVDVREHEASCAHVWIEIMSFLESRLRFFQKV